MRGPRKLWLGLGTLLALALLGVAAASRWTKTVSPDDGIPVVRVERGDLIPTIHATGELRATQSAMLAAPQIGGGSLQITRLLHAGTRVKKNDAVVEFDPSEQEFKLEQSRSELDQADQEIVKARADTAVLAAGDKVALLKARFDVRRAELEVAKNELLSAIDAKKNDLALEQARRVLAQQEQDIQSHTASGQAAIGVAEEKRHKARLAMDQARQNIEKMKLRATMDGIVAIEKNTSGDFNFYGRSLPDFREGDQTHAGAAVARVIDPAEMEVAANLSEQDRSNVKAGQAAEIQLDALPGQVFKGIVKTVAGMANKNFWDDDQTGHFEVTIQLPGSAPRLRPGFTVQVEIAGDRRNNVLCAPRQAVFASDARRVVYVRSGSAFESRPVQVLAETESRAAIEGVSSGAEIAFVNPTVSRRSSAPSGGSALSGAPR
jgi:HlyD family secretion protein